MHFMDALEDRRWASTNLTGHPGITTLWLGALGRKLAFAAGFTGPEFAKGSVAYLALLRLPIALVNSLAVGVGYLLLRRLLAPSTALLAGGLWAASPFVIAHSRLLHLDGLLTSFMTLSVLCLLVALQEWRMQNGECRMEDVPSAEERAQNHSAHSPVPHLASWLFIIAAGCCAGLAFLTKAPSLVLLPVTGVLMLLFMPTQGVWQRVVWVATRYPLWLACAALVFWGGWPAMWNVPSQAIGHVVEEIIANGGQPHGSGNYFLGQPTGDPGWLFYPVVVIWRSAPLTLIGLLLLPLALRRPTSERWTLLALLTFVLLFALSMSILPKKFDRYLLPIWPALEMLAAAGLLHLLNLLPTHVFARFDWQRRRQGLLAMVALVMLLTNGWYHPYYLAYFNPLVGGGASGQYMLLAGWGEGMEQVGAWLRTRPDLQQSPVVSWDQRTLEPFVPVRVVELSERNLQQPASYAVVYSRGAQRDTGADYLQHVRRTPPLYTVRMYGIEYAQVYQPIRPFDMPVDAQFGSGLHLRGISQDVLSHTLTITPSWDIQENQTGGLFSFVHVLDADGQRVGQVDVPIDAGLFAQWEVGQQFGSPLPISLPADLPAGEYQVGLGVYHPQDFRRLPLAQGEALPPDLDGGNVLHLMTLIVDEEGGKRVVWVVIQ